MEKNITNALETPAEINVSMPKVSARKEVVLPANAANIPSESKTPALVIGFDSLLALDIVERNAKGNYNATAATKDARGYLEKANSAIAGNITDNALAVLIASVGKNTEAATKAGRRAATALALIDVNEAYKRIINPATGTAFKNTSSLFRALYPTLADSTIWNYINVGKEIYLPAQNPNAPDYLKLLAGLEPGTALSAVGALKDENARKRLPSKIKEEMKNHGGKLTQSALKAAAKAARNPDTEKKKEDGTRGTEKKDEKAKAELNRNTWKELVRRGMSISSADDDIYITIYENNVPAAKEVFKAAMRDEKSALEFVSALYDSLNIK